MPPFLYSKWSPFVGDISDARNGKKWARPLIFPKYFGKMVVKKKTQQLQKSDSLVEVCIICHGSRDALLNADRQACSLTWDRASCSKSLGKSKGFQVLENGREDPNHMAIREKLLEQALAKMTRDIEVRCWPVHLPIQGEFLIVAGMT